MVTDVFLLADIGGTNARFALCDKAAVGGKTLLTQIYQVRENPTLIGALQHFISAHCSDKKIIAASLAIAGPVLGDSVHLTNSDWVCNRAEIISLLDTDRVYVVNDFVAVAWAISELRPEEKTVLQAGVPVPNRPMIVMGAGTGLGVAALVPDGTRYVPVSTEAGHMRFAPANQDEWENIADILSRFYAFVSVEHLVSGPGLVNLYHARCLSSGIAFTPCQPAEVVDLARKGNPIGKRALADFAAIWGGFASHMALAYNALGGIYLTGGVLQKIAGDFDQRRFLKRFATNPQMADLLGQIPILRVHSEIPAFAGLQALLRQKLS